MDASKLRKINSIIGKVKDEVRPDKSIMQNVDQTVRDINDTAKSLGIDAECVKGGSIAKDTFLKHDHDVDLFVRFSISYDNDALSDMLGKILRKAFPEQELNRIHGSRDYYQFRKDSLDFEIVPVLKIHASIIRESKNITDFSPLHVRWVSKKMLDNPELADEIRAAKQFCKANGVYGAESYINGFSGHIIDILVIHYGSFLSLMKKFASVEILNEDKPIVIDTDKLLEDPLRQLNQSKISPLVVVDPVQPERNAAAALGKEKLEMFIDACKRFLESPSKKFFTIKRFSLKRTMDEFKSSYPDSPIFHIKVKTLSASKDIVGTKVYKAYEDLVKQSQLYGFNIEDSTWNFDFGKKSADILLVFRARTLSLTVEREGPPIAAHEDAERFRQKHENIKTVGNRLYATVKREYPDAEDFLRMLFTKNYIFSRVESIRIEKIYE